MTTKEKIPEQTLCECGNWARAVDLNYLTNHHPNCPNYNDSLIDVWKIGDGPSCYFDNESDALAEPIDSDMKVVKMQMHREVFERLPEFEGF